MTLRLAEAPDFDTAPLGQPRGLVYLVEYRAEDPDVPMLPLHKMTVKQARREMAAVGLRFVENRSGLPWQHVLVFRKSDEPPSRF